MKMPKSVRHARAWAMAHLDRSNPMRRFAVEFREGADVSGSHPVGPVADAILLVRDYCACHKVNPNGGEPVGMFWAVLAAQDMVARGQQVEVELLLYSVVVERGVDPDGNPTLLTRAASAAAP